MTNRLAIENALEELIREENDRRFEDVARALAKKRWPDLIASEPKKDLGADAHAHGSIAVDGGKALACSLTAKLDKVKKDAAKIRDYFPDTRTLIFATPRPVTNQTIADWSNEVANTFGFELIVMPRRDIVDSLMEPEGAWICRDILRITADIPPDDAALIAKAITAATELTANWRSQRRLADEVLIELRAARMNEDGSTSGDVLDLAMMAKELRDRRRMILEAPAGRGKTTTLIQIATTLTSSKSLALLIDLPEWATSGRSLLEYLAGIPIFQANELDDRRLARILNVETGVLLFNGWNELSAASAETAELALRAVERDFHNVGMLVATRPHAIRPPFTDPLRLHLLALSRCERAQYLAEALQERATELQGLIEGSNALDDLTSISFFLRAARRIFEAGRSLPPTKLGILETVLQVVEDKPEHRSSLLRPPLDGYARMYLVALATHMTNRGSVTISQNDARAALHDVSAHLVTTKQSAVACQPALIADALTAHHVLVRG